MNDVPTVNSHAKWVQSLCLDHASRKFERMKKDQVRDRETREALFSSIDIQSEIKRLRGYCADEKSSDYREGLRLMDIAGYLKDDELYMVGLDFVEHRERIAKTGSLQ